MSTIRVDNFGPSAGGTTYSARGIAKAWVNFNGTGTIAARDSENVSSLTDNGAGDYTVNLTTALADANYAADVTHQYVTSGAFSDTISSIRNVSSALATTSARVQHYSGSGVYDAVTMCVTINGDLA